MYFLNILYISFSFLFEAKQCSRKRQLQATAWLSDFHIFLQPKTEHVSAVTLKKNKTELAKNIAGTGYCR